MIEEENGLTISLKDPAMKDLTLWELAEYFKSHATYPMVVFPEFEAKKEIYKNTKFADIGPDAIKIGTVKGVNPDSVITIAAKNGAPEFDVNSDDEAELEKMVVMILKTLKEHDAPEPYSISVSRVSKEAEPLLKAICDKHKAGCTVEKGASEKKDEPENKEKVSLGPRSRL
ncbi:MAG TPA: hypothetical protein VGV92_08900 [Gammaproteobacteria bacterium]|nr:hypothetical protein [Gammaproteobacteria bacterium]